MKNSILSSGNFNLIPQKPLLHFQLSIMMFLQFFVMGCTIPIVSLYMKEYLHFTGVQIGSILAFSAMASFVSPLISTFVADRLISSERLLSLVNFIGAATLYFVSLQTNYFSFLFFFVLYTVVTNPAGALTNAIGFHHLSNSNHFGGIRLWGIIGWIAVAWVFNILSSSNAIPFLSKDLHSALQLSMISSLVLSLYSLFLPKGIKKIDKVKNSAPTDTLKVILDPTIILLSVFSGLVMLIDRFYSFGAAPFLKSIGYAEKDILPILSIGQIPEIFILLILGVLINRFGFKKTILAGVALEIFRFTVFAINKTDFYLFSGILVHGATWALFFVPITIFLDRKCSVQNRAGVQQLYSFIAGTGVIAGNFISGICADLTSSKKGIIAYGDFWSIPAILSALSFIGLFLMFKEPVKKTGKCLPVIVTDLKAKEMLSGQ